VRTGMFSVLSAQLMVLTWAYRLFIALLDLLMVLTWAHRYVECIVRFSDGSDMCVPVCVMYCYIY
jgi:hypothetical protein